MGEMSRDRAIKAKEVACANMITLLFSGRYCWKGSPFVLGLVSFGNEWKLRRIGRSPGN